MANSKSEILESEEWQKATDYEITDEDIERQQKLLGFMSPSRHREYNQTATVDNIRNWSHGCGDDNPLFCDPEYAQGTRWGGVIAPGMMIEGRSDSGSYQEAKKVTVPGYPCLCLRIEMGLLSPDEAWRHDLFLQWR